jgi:hypothetical protein
VEKNFALREGSKLRLATKEDLKALPDTFRVMHGVTRQDCIVLSNSCDNANSLPLILAPIKDFIFPDGYDTPAKQWRLISEMATGAANPKFFYLAASAEFGLRRSRVQLAEMFSVDHSYLQRSISEAETKLLCGLQPEAARHLQWTLTQFFGRNPREDYDWPSRDDLELTEKWLEAQLDEGGGGRHHEKYKADLAEVRERLAK